MLFIEQIFQNFRPRPSSSASAAREQIAALPRIGGMATIPSRIDNLGLVLSTIVPQVETLYLFLHGFETVPDVAVHPKIKVQLASRDDAFRASGKFWGLTVDLRDSVYVCFDDDILYSPDYAERLITGLAQRHGRALVGFHGIRFRQPYADYFRHRRTFHFKRALRSDKPVDAVGTGTSGFLTKNLRFDPRNWPHGDMDDVMLAMEAERVGLARYALHRPRGTLAPLGAFQVDSLYKQGRADSSRHLVQMQRLLTQMGRLLPKS